MDKIDKTTEIQEENQPTKPLGELLKSYRESAAMDHDQAANTLCLTAATLQALENEQFDLLPEAPYIRGYLRSYAKLAHVSSAEAIALYEEIRGGTSTAANLQYNFSPSSSVDSIIKPTISPLLMRFGLIAVVILSLSIISMLPDVREWSTNIWTDFSQKTVAIEERSEQEQAAAKVSENSANTTASNTETAIAMQASTPQTNTQATADNPNIVPQTQAALNNMDGNINRQNPSAVEDNTSTNSTNKNTNNFQDVTAQNTENNTVRETAPEIETPIVATNTTTNTTTATTAVGNTNANTPEPPPIAASTATTAEMSTNATVANVNLAIRTDTTAATVNSNGASATTVTANVAPVMTNPDGTVATIANDPNGDAATEATSETNTEGENIDPEAQPNEVSIKLVFTKEVWMRVDSKKKKVFSGLKKEGDTEEFKASKPLSFKVGNAPGVEIYINGQRYDQAPHTRGAVSRFKIEETP